MARTAIITGAGSGIGKATADLLTRERWNVIGVDLKGTQVIGDLSTYDGRIKAADEALEATGGVLDAVICCAGISAPIAKTCAINYFGAVEFVERLRPSLANSNSPRVALVSSFSSLQKVNDELIDAMLAGDEEQALKIGKQLEDAGPHEGFQNYSSSKRALARWMRRVAPLPEWGGSGIAVNAIGPGVVETPMTRELLANNREMVAGVLPMPLNGHSKPETIAYALAFLVWEESTHMTGQMIYIDGGAETLLRGEDIWSPFAAVNEGGEPEN